VFAFPSITDPDSPAADAVMDDLTQLTKTMQATLREDAHPDAMVWVDDCEGELKC
jgi:hypothetical protein